jgi:hypothetical protein
MAVTIVASTTGTSTAALPAGTTTGDIVVAFAYGSSATVPTLPGSWTNVVNNGSAMSARVQYRVYDGVWTMPTFTNAATTHAVTLRGQDTVTPIGVTSSSNLSQANVVWPTVSLADASGQSRLLRGVAHTRPDSVITAPSGHTSLQAAGTQPGYFTGSKTTTTDGLTATSTVSRSTTYTQVQVEVRCVYAGVTQNATVALTATSSLTATAGRAQNATSSLSAVSLLTAGGTVASGAFDPTQLTGMLFWLDAQAITGFADGDFVYAWPDTSGGGRTATQNQGNAYYAAAGINGHPAMRFGRDALTEYRLSPGHTIGDRTVFQVFKVPPGTAYGSFATTQLQSSDPYLQTYGTSSGTIHTYTTPDLDSGVAWSGAAQFVTVRSDSTAGTQGLEVDGTGVTSAWSPVASSDTFQIGANAAGNYGMSGWIGELLVYERCLTATERGQVQGYLAAKWAVGGPATQQATAALVASSTLTSSAVREPQAAGSLTAAATLTATAVRAQNATATLAASSTLTATATRFGVGVGAAALTATSTLTATATPAQPARWGPDEYIFPPSLVPPGTSPQTMPFTFGMAFAPVVDGRVTAVRFYTYGPGSNRPVSIWTTAGVKLAHGVGPSSEEHTGWYEIPLDTPLLVTAGTQYVASYGWLNSWANFPYTVERPTISASPNITAGTGSYYPGDMDTYGPIDGGQHYYTDVVFQAAMVGPPVQDAAAPLVGTSTLTATAARSAGGAAPLSATSTLTAVAVRTGITTAAVSLTSASTLVATAVSIPATGAAVALTASATLTVTAGRATTATVTLTATSTLTAGGVRAPQAAVTLTATATLTATGIRAVQGVVALVAVSRLTGAGFIAAGVSNVAHTGFLYGYHDGAWSPITNPTLVS